MQLPEDGDCRVGETALGEELVALHEKHHLRTDGRRYNDD
jgi:hypothetical protein